MTKARLLYIALIVVLALSISAPVSAGGPPPPTTVTFTLLTPLPTDLAVGEEYVVAIQVESDQPFNMAMTRAAVYYPAFVMDFGDVANGATSATLYARLIGRRSTAELPGGVTPFQVAAGARFAGGYLASQLFGGLLAVH